MKKPVLKYDSRGPEGNVFWILGHVQRVMQRDGRSAEWEKLWECGSECRARTATTMRCS